MKKLFTICSLMVLPVIGNAQLQNMDFEVWNNPVSTNMLSNSPNGWILSNENTDEVSISQYYYPPQTDAQSGNYALSVGIWYSHVKEIAFQEAPINSRPTALTGFYKYETNEMLDAVTNSLMIDTAHVEVYLTRYNENLAQNDTIGKGILALSTADNFTAFSCPITYTSNEVPDKIKVRLDCSLRNRNLNFQLTAPHAGIGSKFTVDNLVLEANSLGVKEVDAERITIYPNPAQERIYISGFSGKASVYSITGALVQEIDALNENGLNIAHLQPGIYLLEMKNENSKTYEKFIKQ